MAAFESTLEELREADLLLHVLDASSPHHADHASAVFAVLERLGLENTPVMTIWNKADRVEPEALQMLLAAEGGHAVSALTGEGCADLLGTIEQALFRADLQRAVAQ